MSNREVPNHEPNRCTQLDKTTYTAAGAVYPSFCHCWNLCKGMPTHKSEKQGSENDEKEEGKEEAVPCKSRGREGAQLLKCKCCPVSSPRRRTICFPNKAVLEHCSEFWRLRIAEFLELVSIAPILIIPGRPSVPCNMGCHSILEDLLYPVSMCPKKLQPHTTQIVGRGPTSSYILKSEDLLLPLRFSTCSERRSLNRLQHLIASSGLQDRSSSRKYES